MSETKLNERDHWVAREFCGRFADCIIEVGDGERWMSVEQIRRAMDLALARMELLPRERSAFRDLSRSPTAAFAVGVLAGAIMAAGFVAAL